MQSIDRLGWAAGVSVFAYGLRIGVRTNEPKVMGEVMEALPPGWEPGCSPFVDHLFSLRVGATKGRSREFNVLFSGLTKVCRTLSLGEAVHLLEGAVHAHVAEWARNRVFVHAGVVGYRGRAILLPGRTLAGKSTLTEALLRAGATYYSDEYAVLDGAGRVHPFARAVSTREPGLTRCWRPADRGYPVGAGPLPVGLVAMLRHSAGGWRVRAVSPGRALLGMIEHTVPAEREMEMAVTTLEKALTGVDVVEGPRGEAAEAAGRLLAMIDRASPVAA